MNLAQIGLEAQWMATSKKLEFIFLRK